MRLVGLVGQPRAVAALTRAFETGRFHPSLIFHGPPGAGKLTAALSLSRSLLCTAMEDAPCGACSACRRIEADSLRHPDVRVVLPEKLEDFKKGEVAEEGVSGIDVQERQAIACRNPVWSILIDRVREAIAFVNRRPAEGRRRVLIVDQAHRMGAESANALLKTLEEPPEHAVLVLLTPVQHALLPTLRSRCQAVPFLSIPAGAIAAFLQAEHGMAEEEARLRAALSSGRIGTARDLDLEAFQERREGLLLRLESFLRPPDAGQAVARAEELAKSGEVGEADLEILGSLLRDRMLLRAAGPNAPGLVNADIARRLMNLPARDGRDGTDPVLRLESALDGIRRKGNRQLLIEDVFLELLPDDGGAPARPVP
jgi:DNA polymerase-3 subunit delta'